MLTIEKVIQGFKDLERKARNFAKERGSFTVSTAQMQSVKDRANKFAAMNVAMASTAEENALLNGGGVNEPLGLIPIL